MHRCVIFLTGNFANLNGYRMRPTEPVLNWYGEREWIMAEVLYSCILFIHSDIFSTYSSWRYESIQDRLDIGVAILNIFNMILADFTWITENNTGPSLANVRNYLISSFLDSKSSYHINSLLDILAIGNSLSTGFYQSNQFKEAQTVELLIVGSLQLFERLVSIRVSSNRPISFLETAIIDHSVDSSLSSRLGSENTEIIQIIGLYTQYDLNTQIPQKSADVLKMMAVVLQESGVPSSSFVGYFGDDAKSIVSSMLFLLKEELFDQNSGLQTSIYACVSVIISAQPGLASIFLNNDNKEKGDSFEGTINAVIMNGLKKWEKMLKIDIKAFSLMLKVLVVLFYNYSQYRKIVAKWIESEVLWETITAIVDSRLSSAAVEEEDDMANCYWDFVKGHIMHIIALTLHSAKAIESSGIVISAKVYEITRKILSHSIKGSLKPCFGGLDSPYSPELEEWLHSQFASLNMPFNLYSLRIPSWNDEIGRSHGNSYLFDPILLQLKCGDDVNDILNGVCQVNTSLSKMDSFLYKVKGWKELIEIVSVSSLDKVWQKENPLAHGGSEILVETLEFVLSSLKLESREGFAMDILREDLSQLIFFIIGKIVKRETLPTALLQKIVSLLVPIQECMRVDIFKLGPIGHFSAYKFQISLMYSSLLILRAYDCSMKKMIKKVKLDGIEVPIKEGLQVVFPIVINGLSFMINGILARMSVNTDDISLLLTFFAEILRANTSLPAESWMPTLERSRLIEGLGTVFSQALIISDIPLSVAEQILELFLALSKDPLVAELLGINGLVSFLSNNCFSETLIEGRLDPYCNLERNSSHNIWCLMLSVMSNMLLHLGYSSKFVDEVYGFIRLYQNQILKSLKLSPLTYGNATEVLRVSEMFYRLARAEKGLTESDVLCGYQDFGLKLLGEIAFLFRSPNEFQKTAKVISLQEKALVDVDTTETHASLKTRFFLDIELQLVYLCRNLMAHFRCTTKADEMLNMSIPATDVSQNIFQMTMQSHGIQGCSIGSLFDIVRYLLSLLVKKRDQNCQNQVPAGASTLSFTIETCLAVIVTQIALMSSAGELDASLVRELRNEVNQSLQELSNIYKMADNQVASDVWDVKKSISFIGTIIAFAGTF